MNTDFHVHSFLSADSTAPMDLMIERGLELGLTAICFTEHMDFGYFDGNMNFEVDTDAYCKQFLEMKRLYGNRIQLLFGIELGLQPSLAKKHADYLASYPFDFVIGSSHLVNGEDHYYPAFYNEKSEEDSYRLYFLSILENLEAFSNVDVYGHLDYVVRYGPNKNKFYSYEKYKDIIDLILKKLLEKGVGLEINTAGYKYGLGVPNPHPDIIKAYKRLGGEIITIGSDGHAPEHLAYDFHKISQLLIDCGFSYYTVFKKRKPQFIKL